MSKTKRILIDIDGVLSNLTEAYLARLRKDYKVQINKVQLTSYFKEENIVSLTGLTEEEVLRPLRTPGFFQNLEPKNGAVLAVKSLIRKGYDVCIVSALMSKCPGCAGEKIEWLDKYFSMIPEKNVIFAYRKNLVVGDILIDDAIHNLKDFPNLKCVFDAPYNRGFKGDLRLRNWKKAVEKIEQVLNQK